MDKMIWWPLAKDLFWTLVWGCAFYHTVLSFLNVACTIRWKEFVMGRPSLSRLVIACLAWAVLLMFWFN